MQTHWGGGGAYPESRKPRQAASLRPSRRLPWWAGDALESLPREPPLHDDQHQATGWTGRKIAKVKRDCDLRHTRPRRLSAM